MARVGDFFAALYEHYEGGAWTVFGPKKGPFEVARIDERWEESVQGKEDIYFRLCPVSEHPPKGKRGVARASCALTFLAFDLDCGVHKSGKNYFPTVEEAIKWVKNSIPYTFIVGSGTGLHVYCVLAEPLYINDDASFARAHAASARFQQWVRDMCKYDIDSTHDLARVLRVPGSIHSGTNQPVKILSASSSVMLIDVVETLPVSKKPGLPTSIDTGSTARFTLDPSCTLDTSLLLQLSMINPKFGETWTQHRKPKDPSVSGWRFSMISFLMQADLDEQTVADLTIRFLIDQCGFEPSQLKLNRPEVWAAEMTKCRVETFNNDDIEEFVQTAPQDETLAAIATLMEFPDPTQLTKVTRFPVMSGEDNIRDMVIQFHIRNLLGDVASVDLPDPTSRAICTKLIFKKTGLVFPHYFGQGAVRPNENWRKAAAIAWARAEVLTAVESDTSAQLLRAIKSYISASEQAVSLEDARETGRVFKDESDNVYVVPTASLNARATIEYPDLRASREMHTAVIGLGAVGVMKRAQVYRGVRMACLLVPVRLIEDLGT